MMKKILAVLLICALCLSPAAAATEDLFPAVSAYGGFADVAEGAWYTDAVKTCYEVGLMRGTGEGSFSPTKVMTVAEVVTIAARIRSTLTGQPIPSATPVQGQSREWYDDYVDYLIAAGVDVALPTQRATRAQFCTYLSAVVPQSELPAINAVTTLPDSDSADVLRFYNAGILTGTDAYGTFNASGSLTRAECAAMVARIIRPALRQRFTLEEAPAEEAPSYQEELDNTLALLVNGQRVTMTEFVNRMDRLIYNADYNLYSQTGRRLDWNTDYGVGDLRTFFVEQTQSALIADILCEQQAKVLGCEVERLGATLTPNPSQEVLSAYAQGLDYLAAKHILLQTTDTGGSYSEAVAQTLAQQICDTIAARAADPEMARVEFENLLTTYNDDPGMTAYPEGYLFQSGEMVSEFENAVRQLAVGQYTAEPVKSAYGYHVILRLDPAGLTGLKTAYQDAVLDKRMDSWMDEATITLNQVMLDQLDVQGCYETYLQLLLARTGQ